VITSSDVAVVICSIPPRFQDRLPHAMASVYAQTLTPGQVVVQVDHQGLGHAATRNAAMAAVTTEWVTFLDDDDELLPHHLEHLIDVANTVPADLIYPWHQIVDAHGQPMRDLLNGRGVPFDEEELRRNNFIPVTVLARSGAVRAAGFPVSGPGRPWWKCEDWGCWQRMLDNGCTFYHTPEITWKWHHWGGNTSGQGDWAGNTV
jgi:glycosyltransferase involved in cell wall biosynthesis